MERYERTRRAVAASAARASDLEMEQFFLGQPDQWTAKQCAESERIAVIGKHPRERDEVLNLLAPEQPPCRPAGFLKPAGNSAVRKYYTLDGILLEAVLASVLTRPSSICAMR